VIDSIQSIDPSCDPSNGNISNNGEIEIFASGGISSLEYSIDNGASFQSASLFTSLLFGSYQVIVSDGTCSIDTVINLSTNPGPEIDILDARDLSCGEVNGFIAVKVLNPIDPDYVYTFNQGAISISSGATSDDQYSYDQLSEGLWNVSVSDGNGCVADTSVELTISADISINEILIDSVYCNQPDGAFTILASSGNLPIEYSFNSDMSDAQQNGYFNNLIAGNYTVYLRDERFCRDTVNVNLSNSDGVQIDSIQTVDPTCLDHNGEITIFASEGTPPYFYSVDNGITFQTGNFFSGLHDEPYEILVVDATGCVATSEVTLVETNGLSLSVETAPLSCGEQNGEIILLATGGDNNFTYTIDNGIPQSNTSGIFTDLAGGFYNLEVIDGQGCTAYDVALLDSLSSPQIDSIAATTPDCNATNGSINILVSGGTSPYQYSIDNGLSFSSSSLFENLSSGAYQILIQDSLFCQDSLLFNLNTSIQPNITDLILSNPTCGDLSGSAIVIVEDAIAPISYILNGTDTNSTGVFENLNSGTFSLLVIDSLGCTADSSFVLIDNSTPNPPAVTMNSFYACLDTVLISANDPQPSMGEWSVVAGSASILFPSDSISLAINLSDGVNQFVWTISNGICPPTSDTLLINRVDGIIVDAGDAQNAIAGNPVQLIASTSIPGVYNWSPPEYLNNPGIYNPIATLNESTQFIVSVSNDYGCYGEDSVWVYIAQDLIFGTAFTPNNDGNNDTWIIQNIELFPDAEVSIMNRYGNSVFESKGYSTPWDGTFNGKEVPVGSYFYIINLGENYETKTGSISVIR
jgi:gliding motility-associated-like protein